MLRHALLIASLICGSVFIAPSEVNITAAPSTLNPVRNVLLICIDTVRYDSWLLPGRLKGGDEFSHWEKKAVTLLEAQSTSSWTVPAIASVMTGLYPMEHGAGKFEEKIADLSADTPSVLMEEISTLPEILRGKNFETEAFVGSPFLPRVFDDPATLPGIYTLLGDNEIFDRSKGWLANRAPGRTNERFFLYLHLMGAHEEHWMNMDVVEERNKSIPYSLRHLIKQTAPGNVCDIPYKVMCRRYQAYIRSIAHLRKRIARLLQSMEETGLLKDTAVVLFADHGESFQDHLAELKSQSSNPEEITDLGHGHSMYQELLHVPVMIWHPSYSRIPVDVPASLADITPTLIEWLGLSDISMPLSGKSLAVVTSLNSRADLVARPIFSSGIAYGANNSALRFDNWKSIFQPSDGSLLFHLGRDPGEKDPVPDRHLRTLMNRRLANYDLRPDNSGAYTSIKESELEALRSLGYFGNMRRE